MDCLPSVRLEFSSDADFFPAIAHCVVDLAESLGVPIEKLEQVETKSENLVSKLKPGASELASLKVDFDEERMTLSVKSRGQTASEEIPIA